MPAIHLKLILCTLGALSASTIHTRAQPYPTGPFADESAYLSEIYNNTTAISGRDVVGVVRAVELVVDDQIEGKCWTNTSAISAKVRVELEKFGISVFTEKLAANTVFSPVLHIGGLGYRMGNGVCTGQARFELYYFGNTRMGSLGYTNGVFDFLSPVEIWEASAIFTNADRLDQQVLDKVQEWTDVLIADISKARRTEGVKAALAFWSEYNPLTQAEFEAFMKEPND